jgi:RES domain-containing protein
MPATDRVRTLWRISNYADLSGEGGRLTSARWHSLGNPVVYFAESPAGAMLERIVYFSNANGRLPRIYQLLRVDGPVQISVTNLDPQPGVRWKDDQERWTRPLGDKWLSDRRTPLARVPSAIMPNTFNYLLNPAHPHAAQVSITTATRERFDIRLFRFQPR